LRPNIIKHWLVTKHADVEVSGQTVKTCLIKHRLKLHTQRTMGHKLTRATFSARDFNMAERETSQVGNQMFKLKKSIAATILLEILEEDGKRESRRGRTSGWIRKREEKGNFNDIVQKLMIEDTRGCREMMRMTHDGFLELLRLTEPDITPRTL